MIASSKSIGRRSTGGPFLSRHSLKAMRDSSYSIWTLTNSKSSFTFTEDVVSGVALTSWKSIGSATTFNNCSKSLWQINVRRTAYKNEYVPGSVYVDRYSVYPTHQYFTPPSTEPVVLSDGTKQFTFTWENVKYNTRYLDERDCNVTLTASLGPNDAFINLSLVVESNQILPKSTPEEIVISAVHMPSLAFKISSSESENQNTVLSAPLLVGATFLDPITRLRKPRFLTESFNFDYTKKRVYSSGQLIGNSPQVSTSLSRYNFGCPGWMSVPALVWGHRDLKVGTLIYVMDSDGLHAKSFQWFSDDKNMHIRVNDTSDYEVDYYGIGGKHDSTNPGVSNTYQLGWSLRIQPFISPTKWVDWYGFYLYKKGAVVELEANNVVPKSFYSRMVLEEIDREDAEAPAIITSFGHLSGTADDLHQFTSDVQIFCKDITNPSSALIPRVPVHIQSVNLNGRPLTGASPGQLSSNYFGWEPWANQPTGTSYGISGFKSPDFTGVNSTYSGSLIKMLESGQLPYNYLIFPYTISSGSLWTQSVSGLDLSIKSYWGSDYTLKEGDYLNWATGSSSAGGEFVTSSFVTNFSACMGLDVTYDKFVDICNDVNNAGAGLYHDTAGIWGRGCYASGHVYKSGSVTVTGTHPRGGFTHFYNQKQDKWLSGAYFAKFDSVKEGWTGTKQAYALSHATEYIGESLLKYAPNNLLYDAFNPILNVFFSSPTGARPDAVIVSPTTYVAALDPPNWIERTPSYSLIYGDRSRLTVFTPFGVLTNGMNLTGTLFQPGPFSGYNGVGIPDYYDTNLAFREQEFAHCAINYWKSHQRATFGYYAEETKDLNSSFSGLYEVLEDTLTGEYSGYINGIVKPILRLQAYEPDYIFHGTLAHPFESWNTDVVSDTSLTRSSRYTKFSLNSGSESLTVGDDAIACVIKRHRSKNNILVSLINWHSGTHSFSATFQPESYGLTRAYQVYELDVTSALHGLKTLLGTVSARDSYSISTSLDKFEYKILEFAEVTSLNSEAFSELRTDYSYIRYSYDLRELANNQLTIAYSYESLCDNEVAEPHPGFVAPATQEIVNNLPQWMDIRKYRSSNGWQLINSWGMTVENILQDVGDKINSVHLSIADRSLLSKVHYFDIDTEALLEPRRFRNLLFNSSFAIKDVARTQLPAGWSDYNKSEDGVISLDDTTCILGSNSIKIYGSATIGQEIILDTDAIPEIAASCYVLCDDQDVDISVVVSIEKLDGTSVSSEAKLTSRSGLWRRLAFVLPVNSEVYRLHYTIKTDVSNVCYICAPQVEIGRTVSQWTTSSNDTLPYLTSFSRFGPVEARTYGTSSRKIPIFPVGSETEFFDIGIPTRVLKALPPTTDLSAYGSQSHGRRVSFFGEVINTEWVILNGELVERALSPTPWDIYGRYTIKDLRVYEDSLYGTREDCLLTSELQACAIRNKYLYVVVKETFKGRTRYTLKIVKPEVPPLERTYLESIVDFDLGLDDSIIYGQNQISDLFVTSIGFSEDYPEWMVINTSLNQRIYYKLYFDYYYFDSFNNRVYLLEDYKGAEIQVT